MSNLPFDPSIGPEQVTDQVSSLIHRASQLAPGVLVFRDADGQRNELHVGEGYLNSLRSSDGKLVSAGVTILPATDGEPSLPPRTIITKENGDARLIVTADPNEAQPIEGTFVAKKPGEGTTELDRERTMIVASGVVSALEKEIERREDRTITALMEA